MSNKYLEKIAGLSGLSTNHLVHRKGQLMSAIEKHLASTPAATSKVPKVQKALRAGGREERVNREVFDRELASFNKEWA